jgi:hypothetical protein
VNGFFLFLGQGEVFLGDVIAGAFIDFGHIS